MKCVVVGLGQFGIPAARALARAGNEVIAIDREMRPVEEVKDDVTLAVRLDATDDAALAEHAIGDADALIAAIGENFEAQILTVVHAKRLGVRRVIARAANPLRGRILQLVGADDILSPEEDAAQRLVQRLVMPTMHNYLQLAGGFCIIEVDAPSALIGKSLRDADLRQRFRVNVVGIRRWSDGPRSVETFDPVPAPDARIQAGDKLALVGAELDIARFMADYGDA